MKQNKTTMAEGWTWTGLSFKSFYWGRVHVLTSAYDNGGGLAVELVDDDGEPVATLSVNLPEFSHLLAPGEFFVKTWSENEDIVEDAFLSGVFHDTGRRGGIVQAPIWRIR